MALRKLAYLVALAGLAAGATSFVRAPRPYDGALEVSYWYWHRPFRILPSEASQLREMKVSRLFVHAGTFSSTGGLHLTLPQVWSGKADQEIILVFNAHTDLLRDFGKLTNEALKAAMSTAIRQECERAARAGLRVTGIQLDIDSPTRLLGKYGDVLQRLGIELKAARLEFSITVLPTWFQSRHMRAVADAVDYIVPQFYEAETPRNVNDFVPISSLKRLERGLRAAQALGRPFYAGLPSYGHALVYSGTGKLLGGYHDMGISEAILHPGMKLIEHYPVDADGKRATQKTYIGEDVYRFTPRDMRIEDPDAHDQPDHGMGRKPYYLVYDVPSSPMVGQNFVKLRQNRPANCRGVILYRFPERDDSMALPISACATAIANNQPRSHIAAKVVRESDIWDLIDTGTRRPQAINRVYLELVNDGSAGTGLSERAVEVDLRLEGGGLESMDRGGFTTVGSYQSAGLNEPKRCSLKRANMLRFSRSFLAAGEKVRIGPIELKNGPLNAEVDWTVMEAGGFQHTTGQTHVRLK